MQPDCKGLVMARGKADKGPTSFRQHIERLGGQGTLQRTALAAWAGGMFGSHSTSTVGTLNKGPIWK